MMLLLVLAVLVPSLSQSRMITRCELKSRLEEAIKLPVGLERFKESLLSVGEKSHQLLPTAAMANPRSSPTYYGVFQLSDKKFCFSSDPWTDNFCITSCSGESSRLLYIDTRQIVKAAAHRNLLSSRGCSVAWRAGAVARDSTTNMPPSNERGVWAPF
uniref:Lysozyme n=1 Tax=Hippocampus comes TaxID=109280 RepID=A0A3Q2XSJ1_HIPCM